MSIYIDKQRVLTDGDVQIGVTNLLRNTQNGSSFALFDPANNPNSKLVLENPSEAYLRTKLYHVWGPTTKSTLIYHTNALNLTAGYYTFSFYGRNNGKNQETNLIRLYSTYTDKHNGNPLGSTTIGNSFTHASITFYLSEDVAMSNLRWGDYSNSSIPGGSLYYADIKLERGTVATDWNLAPEDILDRLTALESQNGGVNNSAIYFTYRLPSRFSNRKAVA